MSDLYASRMTSSITSRVSSSMGAPFAAYHDVTASLYSRGAWSHFSHAFWLALAATASSPAAVVTLASRREDAFFVCRAKRMYWA